jgi:2-polyprenyl-3-methyl-5-hydroxy-6-metoxy-1,4-benzoquinol methylase
MGTDRDWERWGATDPYFGVLSREKYRSTKLDLSAKKDFFASGEAHVNRVIQTIRESFDPDFAPMSALDFGCGVGRLIIPLSRFVNEVVGMDISPSMLAEAKRNCESQNARNVTLVQSGDPSRVQGQFDLVHSYIVLQHIAWRRGLAILQQLADRVAPGGYLAVQVLNQCHASRMVRFLVGLRYAFPPANWLRNLIRKRRIFEPAMQLHAYDLQVIKSDLLARSFSIPLCIDEPTGSEFSSVFLFARRIPPDKSSKPTR